MIHNRLIHSILLLLISSMAVPGAVAQEPATLFPYPEVPASIENFTERTDYFVSKFWDRCNFKNAFSNRRGMADAFRSFVHFLPTASRDASHKGIDALLAGVKKNPEGLAYITQLAEEELYSDSARFTSDEVIVRFFDAAANEKKLPKEMRDRYRKLLSRVSNSMVDHPAPNVALTLRDNVTEGLKEIIDADTTSITVVWLYDPADASTSQTRTRLDADSRLNTFLDTNQLKMVAIYPGAPSAEWTADAALMPESWTVGASPQADEMFDMLVFPSFYILSNNGTILKKNLTVGQLLDIFYSI